MYIVYNVYYNALYKCTNPVYIIKMKLFNIIKNFTKSILKRIDLNILKLRSSKSPMILHTIIDNRNKGYIIVIVDNPNLL